MFSLEETVIQWVFELYETIGYTGVFVFMILEPTVLPFPGEIVLGLAGWILAKSTLDIFILSFLALLGSLIGCSAEYYLSKLLGRKILTNYGKYFFITNEDFYKTETLFVKYGFYFVFISRLIPLFPKSVTSIIAGIYKMNILTYCLITLIGTYPSILAYLYIGNKLGMKYERILDYIDPIKLPILVVIISLVVFYFFYKFYKMKKTI